jgi:multidrug efflux pump
MVVFALIVMVTGLLYARLPADFLPTEDQGQLLVDIQLPPNASANRTLETTRQIENYYLGDREIRRQIAEAQAAGDKDRVTELSKQLTPTQQATAQTLMVTGSGFSGGGPNAGLGFVILRDWLERDRNQSVQAISERAMHELFAMSGVRDGNVLSILPPAIQGMGTMGGFEFKLLDRSGQGYAALQAAGKELMSNARKSKLINPHSLREVSMPDTAQIKVRIDRDRASALGLSFADINQTLSTAIGSSTTNDFPNQGRMQRVIVQAETGARMAPEDLLRLEVRNAEGQMVPLSSVAEIEWGYGPINVSRFNGYPAMQISGGGAKGVTSGEAMAEMERLAKALPPGFGYQWAGQSLQEQQAGAQVPLLLTLSILVVFLVLAALYESWAIPLSVIMMAPLGMLGSVLAVTLVGMPNDVFFTVGLITIIGLSAKNAVLIVEFTKDLYAEGYDLLDATVEAARLRFRPILMTSLAFGFGVVPLALSTGVASASQRAVGVGVLGGIIAATVLAIFFVPVFFVAVSRMFNTRPKRQGSHSTVFDVDAGSNPAQEH